MSDSGAPVTPPEKADRGTAAPNRESLRIRASRLALPVLLAALGLAGALVAWRTAVANDAAAGETAAGIAAARARTAAIVTNEATVARTLEAWLDYERARRRGVALAEAGFPRTGLRDTNVAASHYFLVIPDYLDADGQYDAARHRTSLLAEATSREDIDPDRHFAAADAEYTRIRGLLAGGVVIAFALPLLTLGELGRGRVRRLAVLCGTIAFALGAVLVALVWL